MLNKTPLLLPYCMIYMSQPEIVDGRPVIPDSRKSDHKQKDTVIHDTNNNNK